MSESKDLDESFLLLSIKVIKIKKDRDALLEAAKLALSALDLLPFKKSFDAYNALVRAITQAELLP